MRKAHKINEAQIKISHLPTQWKTKEFSYLHYLPKYFHAHYALGCSQCRLAQLPAQQGVGDGFQAMVLRFVQRLFEEEEEGEEEETRILCYSSWPQTKRSWHGVIMRANLLSHLENTKWKSTLLCYVFFNLLSLSLFLSRLFLFWLFPRLCFPCIFARSKQRQKQKQKQWQQHYYAIQPRVLLFFNQSIAEMESSIRNCRVRVVG